MVQLIKKDGSRRPLYVVADAVLKEQDKGVVRWRVCAAHGRPVIECGCWQEENKPRPSRRG